MTCRAITVLALALLDGCAVFAEHPPCIADKNCPDDVPFCVAGSCARSRTPGGGEGEGEGGPSFEPVVLSADDVGDSVDEAAFLERPDGIAFVFVTHRPVDAQGISQRELRYGELHATGDIVTEIAEPQFTSELGTLTAVDGGAPVLTTGFGGGVQVRTAPATWTPVAPLPPTGSSGAAIDVGDHLYVGGYTDSSELISNLQTSPLDGSAWTEVTKSFEACRMFVGAHAGTIYAVFDEVRDNIGADASVGPAGTPLPSPDDSPTGLESVDDLHVGVDGRALVLGKDGAGHALLLDLAHGSDPPIDLVDAGAVVDGETPFSATSDGDGHLHVLAVATLAGGTDFFWATDASGAFVRERVVSTTARFFYAGLAVGVDRTVYVALLEMNTDTNGAITSTVLTIHRRSP